MSNPEILRDILRAAADKHAANDDTEAFERVLRAARGLRPNPGRPDPAALHPSLRAQPPGPVRWNDTVKNLIRDLTPPHMRHDKEN